MPDKRTKFHEFALKSILFKGRPDWYFCYLKAERIAHALYVLASSASPQAAQKMEPVLERASALPGEIAHLAAGEIEAPLLLADIFSLLSVLRLLGTEGTIIKENTLLLEREYEQVAERLVQGAHPSPFMNVEDFVTPALPEQAPLVREHSSGQPVLKDIKDLSKTQDQKGHTERTERILKALRGQKSASIKTLAELIKGCSEKTIQRELAALVREGLVLKQGERRWSIYVAIGA